MFAYFGNYPWAHLRLSPQQMVAHICRNGYGEAVRRDTGSPAEEYVANMLREEHINGLSLPEYQLAEFAATNPVEVLMHKISYEGKDLLTPDVAEELKAYPTNQLLDHGFEFCIRRIAA